MTAGADTTPCPINKWELAAGAYFSYGLFACFAAAYFFRGWIWLLPAVFTMIFVPALDALFGEDCSTRHSEPRSSLAGLLLWWAPHGFVVGYTICILVLIRNLAGMTILETVCAIFSTGVIGSIAITASHELIHKSSMVQKIFGRGGLVNVCYLHFEIAHVRGHHVQVGTPFDESTAWKGESLYSYLWRTLPGCLRAAWRLEANRLGKKGLTPWVFENQMLRFALLQSIYLIAIFIVGGWQGISAFFVQAAIAVFFLETVSYIEHYGLMRQELANGRFGNTTPCHSWDSYHRFSNYLEFQLQRHADHHTTPTKSYAELQPIPLESPRLPAGYPVMTTLAMVPPLWRSIMDRRIPART